MTCAGCWSQRVSKRSSFVAVSVSAPAVSESRYLRRGGLCKDCHACRAIMSCRVIIIMTHLLSQDCQPSMRASQSIRLQHCSRPHRCSQRWGLTQTRVHSGTRPPESSVSSPAGGGRSPCPHHTGLPSHQPCDKHKFSQARADRIVLQCCSVFLVIHCNLSRRTLASSCPSQQLPQADSTLQPWRYPCAEQSWWQTLLGVTATVCSMLVAKDLSAKISTNLCNRTAW